MITSSDAVAGRDAAADDRRVRWEVTVRAVHLAVAAASGCLLCLAALSIVVLAPSSAAGDAVAPALLVVAGIGAWGFVVAIRTLIQHCQRPREERYRLD